MMAAVIKSSIWHAVAVRGVARVCGGAAVGQREPARGVYGGFAE